MNIINSYRKIVWGTCWYSEDVNTLIAFLKNSVEQISLIDISYTIVVFDAKFGRSLEEKETLQNSIQCTYFNSDYNKYPNKNFGVTLITEFAFYNDADYIAVVDSDWNIEGFKSFLSGLLSPLFEDDFDIVLPNITPYGGRSNMLIGRPIIDSFHAEHREYLLTAFPGVFAALTKKIYPFISSDNYHWDWGGEWDIVGYSLDERLRICSPLLGMKNVRHRSSQSKTFDAFQIWRAFFQSANYHGLLLRLVDSKTPAFSESVTIRIASCLNGSASNQLRQISELRNKVQLTPTIMQLFNMVLLPLSSLLDGKVVDNSITIPKDDISFPYCRNEMTISSELAKIILCQAIINHELGISEISKFARTKSGDFFGDWTIQDYQEKREKIREQISKVDCLWK
jgi:hypothetical protein